MHVSHLVEFWALSVPFDLTNPLGPGKAEAQCAGSVISGHLNLPLSSSTVDSSSSTFLTSPNESYPYRKYDSASDVDHYGLATFSRVGLWKDSQPDDSPQGRQATPAFWPGRTASSKNILGPSLDQAVGSGEYVDRSAHARRGMTTLVYYRTMSNFPTAAVLHSLVQQFFNMNNHIAGMLDHARFWQRLGLPPEHLDYPVSISHIIEAYQHRLTR